MQNGNWMYGVQQMGSSTAINVILMRYKVKLETLKDVLSDSEECEKGYAEQKELEYARKCIEHIESIVKPAKEDPKTEEVEK